jgi:hypothetical protein
VRGAGHFQTAVHAAQRIADYILLVHSFLTVM